MNPKDRKIYFNMNWNYPLDTGLSYTGVIVGVVYSIAGDGTWLITIPLVLIDISFGWVDR